jgi:hypothetical protein
MLQYRTNSGVRRKPALGQFGELTVDQARSLAQDWLAGVRWQVSEKLPDAALCKAVQEMEDGLIDADLGGFLYKKRVARPGGGKSGGYRTLLSARIGSRYVFLHGFPKSDKANITQGEKKALQFAGKVFLELSAEALSKALQSGELLEVYCEQDH